MKGLEYMPDDGVNYDIFSIQQVSLLLAVGERDWALHIAETYSARAVEWLDYIVKNNQLALNGYSYQQRVLALNEMARAFRAANEKELAVKYESMFNQYYNQCNLLLHDLIETHTYYQYHLLHKVNYYFQEIL